MLSRCPGCLEEIADDAAVCPKCRRDFSKLPRVPEPPPTPRGRPRPEPAALPADNESVDLVFRSLKLDKFLPGLSADQFRKLFPNSGLFLYNAEMIIIRQGRTGRDLFVLCAGTVRVQRLMGTMAAVIAVLGPGEIFGEMAFLDDCPRSATVIAATDAKVFKVAFEDLNYILKSNPVLAQHLRAVAEKRKS